MRKAVLKKNYPVCLGTITREPTWTEFAEVDVKINKAYNNSGTIMIKHKNDIKELETHYNYLNLAKEQKKTIKKLNCDYDWPSPTSADVYYPAKLSLYKIAKRGKIRIFGRKKQDVIADIKSSRAYDEVCRDLLWMYNYETRNICNSHNNAVEHDARQKVHVKSFDPRDNPWYF